MSISSRTSLDQQSSKKITLRFIGQRRKDGLTSVSFRKKWQPALQCLQTKTPQHSCPRPFHGSATQHSNGIKSAVQFSMQQAHAHRSHWQVVGIAVHVSTKVVQGFLDQVSQNSSVLACRHDTREHVPFDRIGCKNFACLGLIVNVFLQSIELRDQQLLPALEPTWANNTWANTPSSFRRGILQVGDDHRLDARRTTT